MEGVGESSSRRPHQLTRIHRIHSTRSHVYHANSSWTTGQSGWLLGRPPLLLLLLLLPAVGPPVATVEHRGDFIWVQLKQKKLCNDQQLLPLLNTVRDKKDFYRIISSLLSSSSSPSYRHHRIIIIALVVP